MLDARQAMATARQLAAGRRRQDILEVAIGLFARYGFAATTTKAIANEAGVAEGLVFHYFPSKLDLLAGMRDHYSTEASQIEDELQVLDPRTPRSGMTAYCHGLLAHLREHADLMAVLAAEAQLDGDLSPLFWETVGARGDLLASWLDRAAQAGAIRAGAPTAAAARVITASLSFLFLQQRRLPDDGWRAVVDDHVAALVEIVLSGIAAPTDEEEP